MFWQGSPEPFLQLNRSIKENMKTGSTSGEAVSLKSFFRILLFGCILSLLLTIAGIVLNPGKFFLEGHIKDRNARYSEIM